MVFFFYCAIQLYGDKIIQLLGYHFFDKKKGILKNVENQKVDCVLRGQHDRVRQLVTEEPSLKKNISKYYLFCLHYQWNYFTRKTNKKISGYRFNCKILWNFILRKHWITQVGHLNCGRFGVDDVLVGTDGDDEWIHLRKLILRTVLRNGSRW